MGLEFGVLIYCSVGDPEIRPQDLFQMLHFTAASPVLGPDGETPSLESILNTYQTLTLL
jgi:hypothetical protein